VVLAAGLGTRMRQPDGEAVLDAAQTAAADRGWKALMPIGGRPFLDYVLSGLADVGVEDVVIVYGPSTRAIPDHYARTPPERVRLEVCEQAEPRGSADALLAAERLAGGGEFLALNSDNLYPAGAYRGLLALGGPGLPVFESGTLVARSNFTQRRIASFAVLEVSPAGELAGIVEKPPASESGRDDALLSMNLWRLPPAIFDACRSVAPSPRGERELPRAVGDAIAAGMRLATFPCDEGVLDLSTRRDVAEVERRLAGLEARP